jgi:hypothetical protein
MILLRYFKAVLLCLLFSVVLNAQQQKTIISYVYANNNSGFIKQAEVKILQNQVILTQSTTNTEGYVKARVPIGVKTRFEVSKKGFKPLVLDTLLTNVAEDTIYLQFALTRAPGYLFDAIISEKITAANKDLYTAPGKEKVFALSVDSTTIEVKNNTTDSVELYYPMREVHTFAHVFEQGNQYQITVKKTGYQDRKFIVNVNIHGCFLCFEGFGSETPGVVENLSTNNTKGSLTANLVMKRADKKSLLANNLKPGPIAKKTKPAAKPKPSTLTAPKPAEETVNILNVKSENYASAATVPIDSNQENAFIDNLNAKAHEANQKLGAQSAEPIIAVDKRQAQTLIDNLNAKVHEANQKLGAQSAEPIIAVDKRQAQTLIDNLNAKVHEANQKLGAQSAQPIIAVDKRQAQTLIDNLNAKVHEANQKLGAQSAEPIIAVDATPKNKVDLPKFLNAIPPDYSGYLIELISTIRPILDSRFFGNYTPIYIDFINGKYAHLIGRFNTEKEAETYLNKMVLTKFPFAKAIKYVNGKQTN